MCTDVSLKSLYMSHAVSFFYETEVEIWANRDSSPRDLYIQTLCVSITKLKAIFEPTLAEDTSTMALLFLSMRAFKRFDI